MSLLALLVLCVLGFFALCLAVMVLGALLELMQAAIGLLVCWYLLHAVGCL